MTIFNVLHVIVHFWVNVNTDRIPNAKRSLLCYHAPVTQFRTNKFWFFFCYGYLVLIDSNLKTGQADGFALPISICELKIIQYSRND